NKEKFQFLINLKNESKPNTNFVFRMDLQSISGRVTDAEGNPIGGVEVSISNKPNEMQVVKKTNKIDHDDLLNEGWNRGGNAPPPQKDRSKDRSEDRDEPLPLLKAITDNDGRYLLPNFSQSAFYGVARYLTLGDIDSAVEICAQAKGYSSVRQRVKPFTEDEIREGLEYLEFMAKTAGNMSEVPQVRKIPETDFPKSKEDLITNIDFVLQKNASISGYLVDSEGKAITGDGDQVIKKIELVCTDKPTTTPLMQYSGVKNLSAEITPEGRFEFPSAEVGNFRFKVQPEKMPLPLRTNPETLTVKAGDRIEDLRVEVEVPKKASLDITVLDAKTRQPVEGYSCVLQDTDVILPGSNNKFRIYPKSEFKTDGKSHFASVPVGPAKLCISVNGKYAIQFFDIEIHEGQNILDPILLLPPGKIVCHVQESDSKEPVGNFNVEIRLVEKGDYRLIDYRLPGNLKKSESQPGEFEILDISQGEVQLEISADGYARLDLETEVKSGETTDLVANIKAEGRLIGQITREGGIKTDSYIVLTQPSGDQSIPCVQGETKADGSYVCKGLPEGENPVIVLCTYYDANGIKHSARQFDTVQVKAGEELRKDFHFAKNTGISGMIELPNETEGVVVSVVDDQPDKFFQKENRLVSQITTKQNKFPYEFQYLSPGTYTIKVWYSDGKEERWAPEKTLTLKSGQVETVSIAD
ncbi:MAG TPA: hypothetical protein PKH31_06515, partial [Candidatus Sumerlaeota bacterium]|nr:hypothetical protein [Candidatus Sumerlaeota bacterium]